MNRFRWYLAALLAVGLGTTALAQNESFTNFLRNAPAATTPLSSSDLVPVLQNGVTKAAPGSAIAGTPNPGVATLAALQASANSQYTTGVWRLDYASGNGAPPLFYAPQSGTCLSHNLINDGGGCVNTTAGDGNSWLAVFPTGMIDVRQFGAIANDSTNSAVAIQAALDYARGIGACAYVPSIYPGFKLTSTLNLTGGGSNCLKGDRLKSLYGTPTFYDLHFTNDTDGLNIIPNNGFDVEGLAIKGSAVSSALATHTRGIYLGSTEGVIRSLWITNFVVCSEFSNGAAEVSPEIFCRDSLEFSYPNIINQYPYAGMLMLGGNFDAAAMRIMGGKYEASGNATDISYTGNGVQTWFQICAPFASGSSGSLATPLTCTDTPQSPMWAADGIHPWFGTGTTQPNGQRWYGPSSASGYKVCGEDYTIWDVSASGGGGAGGGVQLTCGRMTATLVSGNATATVSGITGNIGSNFTCPATCNILAVSDHGLLSATMLTSVTGGNTITLSKPAYMSGTVTLYYTQIAVATGGSPAYSQTCQASRSCGYKIEVRFAVAPPNATQVNLTWQDPFGYAGFDIEAASDYILINPIHVGGYRVLLKHIGHADGGVEFRPTYVEISDQCVEIGPATSYDVFDIHRVINDPIIDCPGYIDPLAGAVRGSYDNQMFLYNGADNGGVTTVKTIVVNGDPSAISFLSLGPTTGPPINGPFSSYELQCEGLTLSGAADILIQFGEGSTPTWETASYRYGGYGVTGAGGTATFNATAGSGITVAGTVPSSAYSVRLIAKTGNLASGLVTHQAGGNSDIDDGSANHTHFMFGGGYEGDKNAITAIRLVTSAGTFGNTGFCSLRGSY